MRPPVSPFALFLRTFGIRQLYCHAPDETGGILLEMHLDDWLRRRGAALIQVQDTSADVDVDVDAFGSARYRRYCSITQNGSQP